MQWRPWFIYNKWWPFCCARLNRSDIAPASILMLITFLALNTMYRGQWLIRVLPGCDHRPLSTIRVTIVQSIQVGLGAEITFFMYTNLNLIGNGSGDKGKPTFVRRKLIDKPDSSTKMSTWNLTINKYKKSMAYPTRVNSYH